MIIAQNVSVIFKTGFLRRDIKALDGFNIDINKGDIYGLLGPNGAGKSTAMYCFLGLIKPDSGSVKVFDAQPLPGTEVFNRIAYVPEEPHYHLYLSVEEALRYYSSLYFEKPSKQKIYDTLEKVGIYKFKDLRLSKCSKGMKQKLGIACALIKDAELVFLDEPTRGLDPLMVKEFRDIILEMNKKGVTFVINSHILSEVETVCNRVAIMNNGRVIKQDDMKNLMKMDLKTYSVKLDFIPDLPGWFNKTGEANGIINGYVPADNITLFFQLAQSAKKNIYECSLKRLTLEEAFFEHIAGSEK